MLKLRLDQMDALGASALMRFIERMGRSLRSNFPAETARLSEGQLRTQIREGMERANALAIRSGANLESFLECEAVYGPAFWENSEYEWARSILGDDSLDETEKLNLINEHQIFGEG